MRAVLLLIGLLSALLVHADEAVIKKIHDEPKVRGSIIASMLEIHENPLLLHLYDTNYIIYTLSSRRNNGIISADGQKKSLDKHEAMFQLSFGFPLWRGILGNNSVLGASYTQRSWWQVANRKESSPFRETNYEPQVFLAWATDYSFAGWRLREMEFGINHQSNGRSTLNSRSWNRGYMRLMAQQGDWQLDLKPWFRFPEATGKDDNADIMKYMGYYRAAVGYTWGDNVISFEGRYNWNTGYGRAQLGWSYPIGRNVRFYTQIASGYGESLLDYNLRQTRAGIGVMLNDIL